MVRHAVSLENARNSGAIGRDIKIYDQNESHAQFKVYVVYTQPFLRGRWRTEEAVYINKEQRWDVSTSVALAHMEGAGWRVITSVALARIVDATPDIGWGARWVFYIGLYSMVRNLYLHVSGCI